MTIKELYEKLKVYAGKFPDAEVRMEVFNANDRNSASKLNSPCSFSMNEQKKQLTIVGDGILQKY